MKLFSNKRKVLIVAISIITGFIAGFAYWKFVGCQSGTCGITANWHTSTLFGGIFGYLIGDSIKVKAEQPESTTDNKEQQA